jgi:SnoaL-like domain
MSVEDLEKRIQAIEDVLAIEKLGRIYGYYLEHWMSKEIVDLFSDGPDVALEWTEGTYYGKEAVRRYFEGIDELYKDQDLVHQLMQLSPVIDVSPDGKTAKARWYGFGGVSVTERGKTKQIFRSGTYENDYVKEGGKWKIQRFRWHLNYDTKPGEGWAQAEHIEDVDSLSGLEGPQPDVPDERCDLEHPYAYILPFHYRHPITGELTSEAARNEPVEKRTTSLRRCDINQF